jgi:hypothetical protein
MVQAERGERRVRRWRSVAEKRRIVELTLEPGAFYRVLPLAHEDSLTRQSVFFIR